jgi:predicted nuclease with TOPRIM domain
MFNLQCTVSNPTKEKFLDTFNSCGANSKGEFISMLLDSYISEDNVKTIEKEVPVDSPELLNRLESLETNNAILKETLERIYFHEKFRALYLSEKGKTLKYKDATRNWHEITIDSELALFNVIMDLTETTL